MVNINNSTAIITVFSLNCVITFANGFSNIIIIMIIYLYKNS